MIGIPRFIMMLLTTLLCLYETPVFSIELRMHAVDPIPRESPSITRPGLLPQSRIAAGDKNIIHAWFSGPTDRYPHGVLGDRWEASQLVVETVDGKRFQVQLPGNRVFEDLEPRLADVDGDNTDEIMVVESDTRSGASLALYGLVSGRLVRMAATPFIGQPNRWLNPVGAGDFDGDGHTDIALVATPHIGGLLRLDLIEGATLKLFAEYSGVSTHRIGSTELGLGHIVSASPRDQLLVPDQARRAIMLLEWTPDGWQEITRVELSGSLGSALMPLQADRWQFRLENGNCYEIQLAN